MRTEKILKDLKADVETDMEMVEASQFITDDVKRTAKEVYKQVLTTIDNYITRAGAEERVRKA